MTSYTWIFQNFTCVFTAILVKFDTYFLGLPWEIVFGFITDNKLLNHWIIFSILVVDYSPHRKDLFAYIFLHFPHQGIKHFMLPRGRDVKTGVIWQGAEKVKTRKFIPGFSLSRTQVIRLCAPHPPSPFTSWQVQIERRPAPRDDLLARLVPLSL